MKLEVIEIEQTESEISDEQRDAMRWLENKFSEWAQDVAHQEAENK